MDEVMESLERADTAPESRGPDAPNPEAPPAPGGRGGFALAASVASAGPGLDDASRPARPAHSGYSFGCSVTPEFAEVFRPVVTDGRGPDRFTPHEIGETGERAACRYLIKHGMQVVERNWRCRLGEADIVARDGDVTVLVEVKTTVALEGGPQAACSRPEERVDEPKRKRYRDLALFYLATHPGVGAVRFDVAALTVIEEGRARIRYITGAFVWDE